MIGKAIHNLAKKLWPINRSITGSGIRDSLSIINNMLPDLKIIDVPSGTKVLDWIVPDEWNITSAWIETPNGSKICNFEDNNLHVLGYSCPVEKYLDLDELNEHLFSLPDQPNAIPYVTSYYKKRWGFSISDYERKKLKKGQYKVTIKSNLFKGVLNYGELIIPGETKKEVFLSTYLCHPSMANNELSGPTVTTYLAKWIQEKKRRYTYRIIFIPETIGSIAYLSKNIKSLKKNVIAGFNITCVGDNRNYSYLPSRNGETLSDNVAKHILKHIDKNFICYTWRDRGSDERQYCAPNVDLPIASIMRTKYGAYNEYHTSLDNLTEVVTPKGLQGGYEALKLSIEAIENNYFPLTKITGEPQMGRRGLYPTLSTKEVNNEVRLMADFITFSDGKTSLIEIAEKCQVPVWSLYELMYKLKEKKIIELL